jgi:hypothetical protein
VKLKLGLVCIVGCVLETVLWLGYGAESRWGNICSSFGGRVNEKSLQLKR